MIGADGVFTVRPEKIRLARSDGARRRPTSSPPSGTSARSSTSAPTRATSCTLDAGGELVVTQQNLQTSSMEALAAQGRAVRLIWKRQHVLSLGRAEPRRTDGGTRGSGDRMRHLRIPASSLACLLRSVWRQPCGTERAQRAARSGARRRRGRAQPRHLGRICRGRRERPGVRLGHAVRGGDRLQGQHHGRHRLGEHGVS